MPQATERQCKNRKWLGERKKWQRNINLATQSKGRRRQCRERKRKRRRVQNQHKANRPLGRVCPGLGHELVRTRPQQCPWIKEQKGKI